jgi:hypothetical protein
VAPRLGPALIPGRVQLSSDGCWVVEAAVTNDPDAITLLTPSELERVQLSKAIPPPDWWAVPEDDEGWEDLLPSVLQQGVAPKCKRRQEQGAARGAEKRRMAAGVAHPGRSSRSGFRAGSSAFSAELLQ